MASGGRCRLALNLYISALVVYTTGMSGQSSHPNDDVRVPLSVVFISVGLVILLAVTAVWILMPTTMPRAVYTAVNSLLPQELMIPTPAAVAILPTQAPQPAPEEVNLLPDTLLDNEGDNGANIMTMAEALNQGPRAGEPTRIVASKIDLDAPVEAIGVTPVQSGGETYYQWLVPNDFVAGWHDNSALLGQPGNTVLNGHHNVYGEVFRDIIDLEVGDELILYDAEQAYKYQVTDKEILLERGQSLEVRLENAQWIAPTEDERITIVTCWPYTDNSHRLVVVAKPISVSQSTK